MGEKGHICLCLDLGGGGGGRGVGGEGMGGSQAVWGDLPGNAQGSSWSVWGRRLEYTVVGVSAIGWADLKRKKIVSLLFLYYNNVSLRVEY